MKKRKLLILDDAEEFRRDHLARLSKSGAVTKFFDLSEVTPDRFKDMLQILEGRRTAAREREYERFDDATSTTPPS